MRLTHEELKYLHPQYSVLFVTRPIDPDHNPWVVIKCSKCGCRFWLHADSGANAAELVAMVHHEPLCDAEWRHGPLGDSSDDPYPTPPNQT